MNYAKIIEQLPYTKPFLFVDSILDISENGAKGTFFFGKELDFYKGHFKDFPITPGVILTECCAQIGLVCLGIYLMEEEPKDRPKQHNVVMTSSSVEFIKPVYPDQRVTVVSEKIYFRFNKLKCKVRMYNDQEELICKGELAGIFKTGVNEA